MCSPKIYKEFNHPYEQRLADFYGGEIFYHHSCGNLTSILDLVTTVQGLKRIEISPWSELSKAADLVRGKKMIIQRRLRRIPDADAQIKGILDRTFDEGRGCIMELDVVDEPLETSQHWIEVSRSYVRSLGRSALN